MGFALFHLAYTFGIKLVSYLTLFVSTSAKRIQIMIFLTGFRDASFQLQREFIRGVRTANIDTLIHVTTPNVVSWANPLTSLPFIFCIISIILLLLFLVLFVEKLLLDHNGLIITVLGNDLVAKTSHYYDEDY